MSENCVCAQQGGGCACVRARVENSEAQFFFFFFFISIFLLVFNPFHFISFHHYYCLKRAGKIFTGGNQFNNNHFSGENGLKIIHMHEDNVQRTEYLSIHNVVNIPSIIFITIYNSSKNVLNNFFRLFFSFLPADSQVPICVSVPEHIRSE